MSAAQLMARAMSKRRNGECRVDIRTGDMFSVDGTTPKSCADCPSLCEQGKQATGLAGSTLQFKTEIVGESRVNMTWACPGCGVMVNEESPLLAIEKTAKTIEADPLCHRCRREIATS